MGLLPRLTWYVEQDKSERKVKPLVVRPRALARCPPSLPLPGTTPPEESPAEASPEAALGSKPSEEIMAEGIPSTVIEEEVAAEPPWPIVVAEVLPRTED